MMWQDLAVAAIGILLAAYLLKDFLAGDLRISSFHALAGYHGCLREKFRGILDGLVDLRM